MDQITHDVRRSNWLNIIEQCQNRPGSITAKQWMKDNGISPKSYYYWLRKFRKEACEKMLPSEDISFHEIQLPQASVQADSASIDVDRTGAAAVVSCGHAVITITNTATTEIATLIIREVLSHA